MNQVLTTLGSADFWIRLVYILLFAVAWQVTELLLVALIILQIAARILAGKPDERLAGFGNSLSQYAWQIGRFVTGASEEKPWPFMEWPEANAQWRREAPIASSDSSTSAGVPPTEATESLQP